MGEKFTGYGDEGEVALPTGEVAKRLGCSPRSLRRWVHRGDIPDGPRGVSGQGAGNELLWSPIALEQARKRSLETRGHDYNRPSMTRGRGHKLPEGKKSW